MSIRHHYPDGPPTKRRITQITLLGGSHRDVVGTGGE
jgi:hypothetical protein